MLRFPGFRSDPQLAAALRNTPPLRKGASGTGVVKLQQALIDLGYELPRSVAKKGQPDGIFGAETEAAVRAFQTEHSLKVDGKAGATTLIALDGIMFSADVLSDWLALLSTAH